MSGNISTNYNAEQPESGVAAIRKDVPDGYEPVASDGYAARVTRVNFEGGTFTAEGISKIGARSAWFSDEVTLDRIAQDARAGDMVVVSATLMRRTGVDQQG